MRRFQDAYKDALNTVPRRRLLANELLAGAPPVGGIRPAGGMWVKGVAAAAILAVCSAGTATAVNYHKSQIRVEEQGYSVTGTAQEGVYDSAKKAGAEPDAYSPEGRMAAGNMSGNPSVEEYGCEEITEQQREYDSVEEFRSSEQITMALPEPEWLGETELKAQIYVSGNSDTVTAMLFGGEERSLFVTQWDTRGYESFGSATSYMGDSENERSFTNAQGFSYVMFDSVEGEEILSTHAVISVEGRELSLDFTGYEEAVIERVLRDLDLSVYFRE